MTLPTVGSSYNTYGTELNAHINVSHDSDGKIKNGAEQTTSAAPTTDAMIANKKYVDDQDTADHPAYTGGESHTDGSGLIIKMGYVAFSTNTATVTFGSAFPTGIVSIVVTPRKATSHFDTPVISAQSVTGFTATQTNSQYTGVNWIAIGY